MFYITMHCFHWYALFPSICQLVIPIDLRAAKALPRNCGHMLLVGRRTPGEGGVFFFFLCSKSNSRFAVWFVYCFIRVFVTVYAEHFESYVRKRCQIVRLFDECRIILSCLIHERRVASLGLDTSLILIVIIASFQWTPNWKVDRVTVID
jgi:hypothetical protein